MYKEQIEKIKNGDLEELDKIYLENKPKFFAYAQKNYSSISIEEIEDIYQDTIIDFYGNIDKGLLTEITSSLSAYIIQIGKMKLLKQYHIKNMTVYDGMSEVDKLVNINDYDHRIDDIVKYVFANTTDMCKQILTLFYYEKKSMSEIAEQLGYKNADTVKAKKNRCITQISSRIQKLYFKDEQ